MSIGVVDVDAAGAGVLGAPESDAPTAMSQRCPGWPCGGLGSLTLAEVLPEVVAGICTADGSKRWEEVGVDMESFAASVPFGSASLPAQAAAKTSSTRGRVVFMVRGGSGMGPVVS
jgi:hypothetical protein